MTSFSKRLKNLRSDKKLSIIELQLKIKKFSYNELYNFESGNVIPKFEKLIYLADFFNCSIDYLIGYSNIKDPDFIVNLQNINKSDINSYKNIIFELQNLNKLSIKAQNNIKNMQSFIINP